MGIGEESELTDPDHAALFWERFWADRSVDFTEPATRRSVQRLAARDSELIEREIRLVDTFALPGADGRATSDVGSEGGRAPHANGLPGDGATRDEARAGRRTRRSADGEVGVALLVVRARDGLRRPQGRREGHSERRADPLREVGPRRGDGAARSLDADGLPIFDKLLARAPVTLEWLSWRSW